MDGPHEIGRGRVWERSEIGTAKSNMLPCSHTNTRIHTQPQAYKHKRQRENKRQKTITVRQTGKRTAHGSSADAETATHERTSVERHTQTHTEIPVCTCRRPLPSVHVA